DSLSAPRLQYRHVTRRDVFRAESVREKNNDALQTILYKHRSRENASQPTKDKITSIHAIHHNSALLQECFSPNEYGSRRGCSRLDRDRSSEYCRYTVDELGGLPPANRGNSMASNPSGAPISGASAHRGRLFHRQQ